jgi:hypothetical protein
MRHAFGAHAGDGPYLAAEFAIVLRELPWAGCLAELATACDAVPNGRRSQSEAICPGNVAIEHNWAAEFVPDTSCAANGMAATQPVWLKRARMANVRRVVMAQVLCRGGY